MVRIKRVFFLLFLQNINDVFYSHSFLGKAISKLGQLWFLFPFHDTAAPPNKVCHPALPPVTHDHSFTRSSLSKDLFWNSFME